MSLFPSAKNLEHVKAQQIMVFFAGFYVFLDLCSDLLSHRLVSVNHFVFAASAFTYPLTYLINDAVAEVSGLKVARTMIWLGLLVDLLFVAILFGVLHTCHHRIIGL